MSDPEEFAKQNAGVLLPGVEPEIGEMVLATLYGNPEASLAQIIVGLAATAPAPEVAIELTNAVIEVALCKGNALGDLVWVEETGSSILTGLRRMNHRSGIQVGPNAWPLVALLTSPPKSVTVETSKGRRRVWLAAEDLGDVVMMQSEVVALGNAVVETFGGRIVEDRMGGDVLERSMKELRLSKEGKARAEALNKAAEMAVQAHKDKNLRPGHNRVAIAEAFPGTLANGLRIHPEEDSDRVYEVEARVNDSWVLAVAMGAGSAFNVEACAWVREDGRPPVDMKGAAKHAGFSDEPAIARS